MSGATVTQPVSKERSPKYKANFRKYRNKQKQARKNNRMILILLRINPVCADCGEFMSEHVDRPHLVGTTYGSTIICGECYSPEQHGEPITLYQMGTRPDKPRK